VQGQTQSDEIAVADGSTNQMYSLDAGQAVVGGSIAITVQEPGGPAVWREVPTLATSTPADRDFVTQRAADGTTSLLFGDGQNGMIPPKGARIDATYRLRGAANGNVPANTQFATAIGEIKDARNPLAAAGSTDGDTIERARRFAPRLFRTQDRAVTADDYRDLVQQVPGVGKAEAVVAGWNEVVLFVAPAGTVTEPSDLLKRDVLAFVEPRRMTTTSVKIIGPQPADIYITADVNAQPYFYKADVQRAVEDAVASYFAFDAISFGQPIYLSKVYDLIQNLTQVASVNVTEFGRTPGGGVAAQGVVPLEPYELPRPGYRDNPDTPPFPSNPDLRPPLLANVSGGVEGT